MAQIMQHDMCITRDCALSYVLPGSMTTLSFSIYGTYSRPAPLNNGGRGVWPETPCGCTLE